MESPCTAIPSSSRRRYYRSCYQQHHEARQEDNDEVVKLLLVRCVHLCSYKDQIKGKLKEHACEVRVGPGEDMDTWILPKRQPVAPALVKILGFNEWL